MLDKQVKETEILWQYSLAETIIQSLSEVWELRNRRSRGQEREVF